MRTHRDPSHVPRGEESPVLVIESARGFEVRCNTPGRELLGTFPNKTMLDIFLSAVLDLCGGRARQPGAELAAA